MAGFLKTEENRRLAVSAGSAAVVYILLFLFFAVYFAVDRREPQSFGASAVYLNLTQVSQAAVREEGANPSSGSSAKQSSSTQSVGFNAVGFNAVGFNAVGFNAVGFNAVGFNAVGCRFSGTSGANGS